MATETSAPVVAGITTEERAYATRYKQGGRTVFALTLSPAELINMVAQPNPNIPNPGNRAIRETHARAFADYYLAHDNWVIPALILRAPSIFKFDADHENGWGILSYPKRSGANIQILDGQHRILGFHLASQIIQQRLVGAHDFYAKAMRAEHDNKNAPAVREAERARRDALTLEARFSSERVSIEIQVTDNTEEYRQMFFDIADNALGITASVKALFDTRKVVNRALSLVLQHPLLENRVDVQNDRIARNSPLFASARHVGDIIRAAQVGVDGRIGKVMERTLNDQTVARNAVAFLDAATESFPQLKSLEDGQVSAQKLRETGLLGSPAMLRILAGVYHELLSERHQWSREEVIEFFKTLNPHMAGNAHANSIWMRIESQDQKGNKQKAFTEGAFAPNGRRQDLAAVEDTLVDWAILGKKGAPFVWAKPADAPIPEPTEEEAEEAELLALDLAADPELEELLAEQASFNSKVETQGKARRGAKK